jgi:hypothetical protein
MASTVSHLLFFTDIQPEFYTASHSKKDYEEYGPSLVRRFSVFGSAV